MEKLKNTKLLGIIGAAITLIGIFLPFATVSVNFMGVKASDSVSFMEGKGVIVLLLTIVTFLIIFADMLASKVPFFGKLANQKLVLIPVVISAIFIIIDMVDAGNAMGSIKGIKGMKDLVKVSFGIGTWTMWLGLIATAAYPFLYKKGE